MKDGFDKSVAEKMPRMQKKRPNRPWNVDPVLLSAQEEEKKKPPKAVEPEQTPRKAPQEPLVNPSKAVETIIDLNADLSQMILEKKDLQIQLRQNAKTIAEKESENALLKDNVAILEGTVTESKMLEREIDFLNEQLDDADHYIKNMVGLLDERTQNLERESAQRKELEGKFTRITREIQNKARMDVKVSILERDLLISTNRVHELESKLEEESMKREPLEREIVELKDALDKVYSSLAQIRLKAKREVYGS